MNDIRSSQKAQNLARIRDNQRRSRARRKEYLQELEAKIRACEQIGIEASSEIQSAARKVVDENRKLRSLLHERGVSEAEIVMALGGSGDRSYDQISTAPSLNARLDRKLTCNTLSSTELPAPSQQVPTVPAISIPPLRSTTLSCTDSPSPGSIVSSMGTPPPATYSTSFFSTPVTPPAPEIKTEDVRYGYSYDQSYNNAWQYPDEYQLLGQSPAYYNTSSCVDAANIIRNMRVDEMQESDTDLGFRVRNQNCYVNSNMVFNMMDKYSTQHSIV
ncbi:hypothetical protein HBI81_143140 [Parastagonospora nodorum]|nr:hypothetical protein HBH47_194620 [Parastagonospora nodorum]KAH5248705.1 hypothetical protein HBI72_164420 [Parastagonospora nodorum]KAH5535196.1 hypothetical protein HBI27_174240 [Parastagonospora nodorum]KAH5760896.1 hypothetical protein HBI16_185380 [Parastagonospora nodorum]KAH6358208.1 hypothetical protein HBI34_210900 [Parastagonospora nodorum]